MALRTYVLLGFDYEKLPHRLNDREHGQPVKEVDMAKRSVEERFWEKVDKSGDCWNWVGSDNGRGYGIFYHDGRYSRAHRFAYELMVGPIPEGLTLDHLCRNTYCVRPRHLQPVIHQVNVLRGNAPTARNARKTHCNSGHPLSGSNLYVRPTGFRECRTCARQANRRWVDKQ